jgi:hypothetical protein
MMEKYFEHLDYLLKILVIINDFLLIIVGALILVVFFIITSPIVLTVWAIRKLAGHKQ